MSSLASHLYNRAHGRIQLDNTDNADTSGLYPCAVPPSGKKLAIMRILIAPEDAGADAAITIESYTGADAKIADIFVALEFALEFPLDLDLSSCPIILKTDEYLAYSTAATAKTVRLTVTSYVLD